MVQVRSLTAVLLALAACGLSPQLRAQEQPAKSKFDQQIEGKTKIEGLWTLYLKEQQLLAEFKPSDLGKEFIVLPSISRGVSSGMVIGGMSWQGEDDVIWTFKKVDEKLFVIRRNVRYKATPDSPEAKAVELAYSDSVLHALPILATSPRQTILVDLSPVFMNDDLEIGRALGFGFRFANDRSTWGKVKSFPNNVELQLSAVYSGSGSVSTVPDSKGVQVGVHYSISLLPPVGSNGYKPRVADDRVGYFLTAVKDFSNRNDDEHFNRYITRWDLRKRDSNLEVSQPTVPIDFYIEKTTPVFLRPTIEAGILEWNKAFQKIGFSGAIRVHNEEDLEGSLGVDIDPEDVRYNFFRWITADAGFAMGPSRVDPRTGQILDADIIFDAGFLDSWKSQYETFTPQTAAQLMPNWMPHEHGVLDSLMGPRHTCTYCKDAQQQMGFAAAFMMASGLAADGKLPEELVHQGLKEVVMHEVGHTLGLRHNFKASAWKTLEEINHPERSKTEPTVASVMDYSPPNLAPKGQPQGAYYTSTIGPYDYWAIEYGYGIFKDEKADLAKVAARSGEPGLEYLTDEDTRGTLDSDPLSNRFDLGKDSLAYLRRQLQTSSELLPVVVERGVKDGDGYQRATQMFGLLFREYWRTLGFASRFPGGVYVSRDHKGDAGKRPPFQTASVAEQRDAMKLLSEFAFSPPKIDGPQLNYLAVSRWSHWGMPNATRLDMPIYEQVLNGQTAILYQLMSPTRLRRILDNEYKVGADQEAYTLAEHLRLVTDGIFSEWKPTEAKGEYTVRKPFIDGFRRNLQREAIKQYASLVTQPTGPEDARTLARMHLQSLNGQIGTLLQNGELKLDDYSRAHLQDCQTKITQALEAKISLPSVN